MRPEKYFSNREEFVQFKSKIKSVPCPHCHKTGFLILHGPLYGLCFDPKGQALNRGHRYLCSHRRKRRGCGRTFSILMSYVLKYLQASTSCLWKFLSSLKEAKPKNAVFKLRSFPFTHRCANRWLEQLNKYQYRIRAQLLKKALPLHSNSKHPLNQLLLHLRTVFIDAFCPIWAYQKHFQISFLKD